MAGKNNPIGYTYLDYDVSNDKVTVEQLYDIKKDILGSAVDSWTDANGVTHGLTYSKKSKSNFALNTSAFQNENRSIVNAINLIQLTAEEAKATTEDALKIFNQALGNTTSSIGRQDFNKLTTLMGQSNIISGLLDYYTNGLGFNSTNFRGLYKEYTQAELDAGAVDLIPLGSVLNAGDVIKDENGVYYKIISQALINNNGVKPTIEDLRRAGAIDGNWEVKSDGIIFRGQYNPGEEYKKNDLFYNEKQIGIDPYQEIVDVFYLVTKDGIAPLDLNDFSSNIIAINDKAEIKSDVDELKNKLGNLSFSAFGQSIKNATDAINDLNTKVTNLEKGKIDLQITDGDLVEFKNKELVDSGVKVEDLIFSRDI